MHEDFFSDPMPMQIYKESVQAIIGRINTINGRMYRDDPTIMAWCDSRVLRHTAGMRVSGLISEGEPVNAMPRRTRKADLTAHRVQG